jgi:predicted class III extradiol MEMO1 family dioxygenase
VQHQRSFRYSDKTISNPKYSEGLKIVSDDLQHWKLQDPSTQKDSKVSNELQHWRSFRIQVLKT